MTRGAALVVALLVAGCVPRLAPLTGTAAPSAALPGAALAPGHHQLVFTWEYTDRDMDVRGDGVARVSAPDSARLDLFLAGGLGEGAAVLIDDSLQVPGGAIIRRMIPPPSLLWAALGRAALPNLPDTVIRVDGTTLRADVGRPVAWRLTFQNDTLRHVEHVEGGRVIEWVDHPDSAHVRYRNERARRSLQLTLTRVFEVPEFDASIWRLDR